MALSPYGSTSHCVLHVDCDSFFCQVEVLRQPCLCGIPLAIQQHQDVIALNTAAKQAGVKKHMPPKQARALLSAAGGQLVHVFTEPDGRVSYRPYREASAALMRLLRGGLPPPTCLAVAVVERASIDEAFMAVRLPGERHQGGAAAPAAGIPVSDMPSWVAAATSSPSPPAAASWDLSPGASVAAAVRAAVSSALGLTVSVGVAPNKLLAKLASRAAKPDGVVVVDSVAAVQHLLAETPVDRLPGLGGAVAAALRSRGITAIGQLQGHSQAQLASLLGGQQQSKLAGRLVALGWGRDDTPVLDKGPPKSIQVQMTLTPQARPLPPNLAAAAAQGRVLGQAGSSGHPPAAAAAAAAAAGPADLPGSGVLLPLLTGAADTAPRLTAVLGAMTQDLLGRVLLDRHTEDRWPRKLALTLTTGGGQRHHPPRAASRSTAFPTPALLTAGGSTPQHQQQQQGQADAPVAAAAAFSAPGVVGEKSYAVGPGLHEAVVGAATGLAQVCVSPLPPGQPITQLNLAVSNFGPFEAAAASGSIRRFTTAAATAAAAISGSAAGTRQQQQQQQQGRVLLPPAHPAVPAAASKASMQSMEQQRQMLASRSNAMVSGTHTNQQPQQQPLQGVLPRPAVAPPQQHGSMAAAAAAGRPRNAAAVHLARPPVLLSDVLAHLAAGSTSADAAEAQLSQLLAAAGGLPRLMPGCGEH